MKKIMFTAILFISTLSFSYAKGSEQEAQFLTKISSLIKVNKVMDALQLNGSANIWVTVDENKTLHVESVESENFITAFYIKQTLNGQQVDVDDSMIGKTFAVEVDFMPSN